MVEEGTSCYIHRIQGAGDTHALVRAGAAR